MNTQRPERLALLRAATALLLLLAASPALAAAGNIFQGGQNPLANFIAFMTGPFAYGVVILALLAAGASFAYGGDFSGWSRRFLLVAGGGGMVVMAETVVSNLFGASTGFSVPPDMALLAWPWPDGAEAGP